MKIGDRVVVVGEFVAGSSLLVYGDGARCGERGFIEMQVFLDGWRVLLDGDIASVEFFAQEIRELDAVELLAELA